MLISNWYHPPNSKIELLDIFESFLQKVDSENKELIITGDLNCNLAIDKNIHIKKLNDLMDVYQLQQHIKSPTRVTATSKTLLDLILTKIDDTKTVNAGVIHLGISDHSLVFIYLKLLTPVRQRKVKCEYKP